MQQGCICQERWNPGADLATKGRTLKTFQVITAQVQLADVAQGRHDVLDGVDPVERQVELAQVGQELQILDPLDGIVRKIHVLQVRREFL